MKFTPTKRRLTTSHLPILQPVLKLALPSYPIYSNSLPLPSVTFYARPRVSRGSAIHVFLVIKGVPVFLVGQYKKQQQISALCYTYYDAGFRIPIVGLSALIFPKIPIGIFLYCKKHYLSKSLDKVN